jgi:hypothetical protein
MHCYAVNATLTAPNGQVYVIGKPQADASGNEERVTITSPNAAAAGNPKDLYDSWVAMVQKGLAAGDTTSNGVVNVGDRWVCRPPDGSHPANASISTAGGTTSFACHAVNASMQTSSGQMIVIGHVQARPRPAPAMTAPPYAEGLSVEQMNASWNNYVNRVFDTATSAAGGG